MKRYYICKKFGDCAFLVVMAETLKDCWKYLDDNRVIYGFIYHAYPRKEDV